MAPNSLPLFPLKLVLFPGQILPLHIFEDRYREMVALCLETSEPFGVVATIGSDMATVGTLARIQTVLKEYPDGRMDIRTVGEERFRIVVVHSDKAYSTGSVEYISDTTEEVGQTDRQRLSALHMRLMEMIGEEIRPSDYNQVKNLSYRVANRSGLSLEQQQDFLEMTGEPDRIEWLIQHLSEMIPKLREAQEREERVRSNGHFS